MSSHQQALKSSTLPKLHSLPKAYPSTSKVLENYKDCQSSNMSNEKDKSKVHKLSLKGSSKLIAEFFEYSINTILYQRGVYPAEDFTAVKKYGLNMLVSADDQVKAYIKKIMSQLNKWMLGGKISKLVVVITSKETGEHVERWQFDVHIFNKSSKKTTSQKSTDKENAVPEDAEPPPEKTEKEIQSEIQSIFRQITASVTFLPQLDGNFTYNVLVYADADSDVPLEWGDSDAREIKDAEKVQLRSFSTSNHKVDTLTGRMIYVELYGPSAIAILVYAG
ncbi:Mitotic spindle checkpoint component mad2 [Xylographa vitiligo]|nr:Mitotic spindle checkpoint component mad2 [Xylographa vitiligo]